MNKLFKLFFKNEIFKHSNEWALVILRIIPSFYLFYYHGFKKIIGGSGTWEWLGEAAISLLGINFGFVFFGFLAASSEGVLTWFVMMGIFTRFSSFFIFITMFFAGLYHLVQGDSGELALIYFTIYFTIFLIGPGKFSLDYKIFRKF